MKLSWLRNLSMKRKLFVSYLAVMMIPLTILGAYSFQQSKQMQVQQAQVVLQDSLQKMEDSLNYKLQRFNSAIELITFNPNFSRIFNDEYTDYYSMYTDLSENVDPLLDTTLMLNHDIKRIMIYTGNNITQRINSIMPITTVEHEFWYDEVMKSSQTNWYVQDGRIFGVRRIFGDINYDKRNLVYVELKPEFFTSLTDTSTKEFSIIVSDAKQQVLYANPKVAQLPAGGETNGDEVVLSQPLREANWTISLLYSTKALTINPWKIVRATIVIESICFVVLFFIIWLFTRGFVGRIHSLNQKMRLVEQGKLTATGTDIVVRDEIGELELRFGKMLNSINLLIEEGYKNKISQKEAELRALQSQINPHFLYNALSVINWKAIAAGSDDISNVAGLLSTFYRTSLNKGKDMMSVRDELLNTKSYMEMQLIMHDDNFDVVYQIDDEVLDCYMIKLVLQPIVENAIEHGIDQKRTGRGVLQISASFDGGTIVFIVQDNGPGMTRELVDEVLVQQSKGYGLYNVQERIRVQYGSGYGISIKSELGEGTCVTVKLPK
ncbi:two-component system sensor histidine kinase YesM [Paenibacillus taihuensis]|uniref:histidine kinase n=1 Tax=Paenibacillus taihuensis TaxID=1156355 RepID=A0A3D9RM38_9BACL|nr:histidine kinase [Paenibacillus taihuensis]REE80969.1 two-component system sensor histidine kinase YesM [Paenibacillus taihuensis]